MQASYGWLWLVIPALLSCVTPTVGIACLKAAGYNFVPGAVVPDAYLYDMQGTYSTVARLRTKCSREMTCSGFTWPGKRFVFGQPPGLRPVISNATYCAGVYMSSKYLWGMPAEYEKADLLQAIPNANNATTKYRKQVSYGKDLVGAWALAKSTSSSFWEQAKASAGDDYKPSLFLAVAPTEYCSCRSADNAGNIYTPDVLNQAPCNSCSAFASSTAATIARLKFMRKNYTDSDQLSPQYIGYCLPQHIPTCSMTILPNVVPDNLATSGTYFYDCLPYTPNDVFNCTPKCSGKVAGNNYKLNFTWMPWENKDVQSCIQKSGAFYTWFNIFPDFVTFFHNATTKNQVYNPDPTQMSIGGHAVPIVGYNADQGYWLVQNSWGTQWGDNGFFRIAMGTAGLAGKGGACITYDDGTSRRRLSSLDLSTFDPEDLINFVSADTTILDLLDLFGLSEDNIEPLLDTLAPVLGSKGLGKIGYRILDPEYLKTQSCKLADRKDVIDYVVQNLPFAEGSLEAFQQFCNKTHGQLKDLLPVANSTITGLEKGLSDNSTITEINDVLAAENSTITGLEHALSKNSSVEHVLGDLFKQELRRRSRRRMQRK